MTIVLSQTQHCCGLQDKWLAREIYAKRIESVARKSFLTDPECAMQH